jgi:hypothetical protein
MNLAGRDLTDVRLWTYRLGEEDQLTEDGCFWLCFADGFVKVTAVGDSSLELVPAAKFSADDVRELLADDGPDVDFRWLSLVHMLFSDLPVRRVVGYETTEHAGVTTALELRLGDGNRWIRFDAWHVCGSLTVSGDYRDPAATPSSTACVT